MLKSDIKSKLEDILCYGILVCNFAKVYATCAVVIFIVIFFFVHILKALLFTKYLVLLMFFS